ncbi:unnamed protein product [Onchocerca flexuosa]|uniref:IBB domain-containing protein n=1 Tax=Onchocerca flexuosa TaxID=387005 RepID=A0A183H3Z0_9BILA|nr:unnamed protein product [Onchocerca flexuosa]
MYKDNNKHMSSIDRLTFLSHFPEKSSLSEEMDEQGPSSSGNDVSSHEAMYKNRGMTSDAMRKRREEVCAEIRKARRFDDLNKRRQIDLAPPEIVEESEREFVGTLALLVCTTMDERIIAKLYGECPEDVEQSLDFYRRRFRTSNFSVA